MNLSVVSAQQRLEALERKAATAPISLDAELQSQLARFLCVLASGFIEQATISILEEYVRRRSHARVQRFAAHHLSRFQNAKFEDVLTLVGRFDPSWRTHLEKSVEEEVKSSLDSIVNNRNQIAHGKQVNISLGTFSEYYLHVKSFVIFLDDFLRTQ